MKRGLGLLLISSAAVPAPRPITPLYESARKLGEQSSSRVMAFAAAMNIDLDLKNATRDALAELEVDHGADTQFRGCQTCSTGPPTANRHMWGLDPAPSGPSTGAWWFGVRHRRGTTPRPRQLEAERDPHGDLVRVTAQRELLATAHRDQAHADLDDAEQ